MTQALSKYGVGLSLPVTELVAFTTVAIVAGRARGDHPRPARVAHQRAQRAAVRIGDLAGRRMRRRPAFPPSYGVVVLSVKVSVLLYAPVRSASVALTSWLN